MSKVARAKSHLQQKMQGHSTESSAQDRGSQHPPSPPPQQPCTTLVDKSEFDRAVHDGLKDSRLGAWSKPAKIALLYLANTKPRFSMSTEVAKHLEAGLNRDYPELMHSIQDKLSDIDS